MNAFELMTESSIFDILFLQKCFNMMLLIHSYKSLCQIQLDLSGQAKLQRRLIALGSVLEIINVICCDMKKKLVKERWVPKY